MSFGSGFLDKERLARAKAARVPFEDFLGLNAEAAARGEGPAQPTADDLRPKDNAGLIGRSLGADGDPETGGFLGGLVKQYLLGTLGTGGPGEGLVADSAGSQVANLAKGVSSAPGGSNFLGLAADAIGKGRDTLATSIVDPVANAISNTPIVGPGFDAFESFVAATGGNFDVADERQQRRRAEDDRPRTSIADLFAPVDMPEPGVTTKVLNSISNVIGAVKFGRKPSDVSADRAFVATQLGIKSGNAAINAYQTLGEVSKVAGDTRLRLSLTSNQDERDLIVSTEEDRLRNTLGDDIADAFVEQVNVNPDAIFPDIDTLAQLSPRLALEVTRGDTKGIIEALSDETTQKAVSAWQYNKMLSGGGREKFDFIKNKIDNDPKLRARVFDDDGMVDLAEARRVHDEMDLSEGQKIAPGLWALAAQNAGITQSNFGFFTAEESNKQLLEELNNERKINLKSSELKTDAEIDRRDIISRVQRARITASDTTLTTMSRLRGGIIPEMFSFLDRAEIRVKMAGGNVLKLDLLSEPQRLASNAMTRGFAAEVQGVFDAVKIAQEADPKVSDADVKLLGTMVTDLREIFSVTTGSIDLESAMVKVQDFTRQAAGIGIATRRDLGTNNQTSVRTIIREVDRFVSKQDEEITNRISGGEQFQTVGQAKQWLKEMDAAIKAEFGQDLDILDVLEGPKAAELRRAGVI